MATPIRTKSRRLKVRTTDEERELIDRAVESAGTELSCFVVEHLMDAARQVLADHDHFVLSPEVAAQWEKVNRRSAKELLGLRKLVLRPSPFTE